MKDTPIRPTPLDTPCEEWTGARVRGYGRKKVNGRMVSVHRLVWERAHGPIPPGVIIMHICDNPPCFNVEHLKAGTYADNTRDMMLKGRGDWSNAAVETSRHAKLKWEQVRDIRARSLAGEGSGILSREYGVRRETIRLIVRGLIWRERSA